MTRINPREHFKMCRARKVSTATAPTAKTIPAMVVAAISVVVVGLLLFHLL